MRPRLALLVLSTIFITPLLLLRAESDTVEAPILAPDDVQNFDIPEQNITFSLPKQYSRIPPQSAESPVLIILRHKEGLPTLNAVLLAGLPTTDTAQAKSSLENDYRSVGFQNVSVKRVKKLFIDSHTLAIEAEIHFYRGKEQMVTRTMSLLYPDHQILFTLLYKPEQENKALMNWEFFKINLKSPPSNFNHDAQERKYEFNLIMLALVSIGLLPVLLFFRFFSRNKKKLH